MPAGDAAAGAGAERLTLPSGAQVEWLDVLNDTAGVQGATARFRFVDENLKPGEDRGADMQALCDTFALTRVEGMVPPPRQIVIALADRPVAFGQTDPDAVQLFEAYRLENAACIWEMF
ncbi:acetolactate synthase [Xinfangfangia sp. D13-10-4-6]|nr:acetolactate synthase [Pseudogemmobacter hezensis]